MESYYMITGDETVRYTNGSIVTDPNIDLFVKKAEEELVSATISWGINHKDELVDKMISYGVSAIARNTYQYIYPYYDDENHFALMVIHFNLIPCKEIRITDTGIMLAYPEWEGVEIEVGTIKVPFFVNSSGEFRNLYPSYQDSLGLTTKDFLVGYQTCLLENSESVIKNALKNYKDYKAIKESKDSTEFNTCLESVYDSMNALKMKLSESHVSNNRAVQIWTEIVKNIQESYCETSLNIEASIKEDSDFMVDESAAENIKVPKEENKELNEEPVKMTKGEFLDELLKKAVSSVGLPPELIDFCDGKKDAGEVNIVPISIERSKTPETWKELSDSIKEHNKNQQQKNCHNVEVEPSPIVDLLMELLGNHQKDVND